MNILFIKSYRFAQRYMTCLNKYRAKLKQQGKHVSFEDILSTTVDKLLRTLSIRGRLILAGGGERLIRLWCLW